MCSLLISNSFCLFKVYVKTIKKHFEQDWTCNLITASINIKVILSVIGNSQCLTDGRCSWGLGIFLFKDKSTISGFAPPCRQLILYRFLECLSIHYHYWVPSESKNRWSLSASIISLAILKRWSMSFTATRILLIWFSSQ